MRVLLANGCNLRALRQRAGLTLDRLAAETALSEGFLSRVEHGQRGLSGRSTDLIVTALDRALRERTGEGVRLDDVVDEVDADPVPRPRRAQGDDTVERGRAVA